MYLVRHSERLDFVDKQKWIKTDRYKENDSESPITPDGYKIAKQTMIDIMKNDDREIGNIYCSPSERCIQTALEFQKQIYKKYDKKVLIKIENGLIYWLNNIYYNTQTKIKIENNKIVLDQSELKVIDYYMEPKEIYKRYGIDNFDSKYKPIYSVEKINAEKVNEEKSINRTIKTILKLYSKNDMDKLNILCSHGELLFTLFTFCSKNKNMSYILPIIYKTFVYNDFCYWFKFDIENDKVKLLELKNKNGIQTIKNNIIT
jgi:hypothetical protein